MPPLHATTPLGCVEYTDSGSGTPILFVHGGHCNCLDPFPVKGLDTDEFRLIIPSRPGYGNTPLNGHDTPEKAADLLAAFLDELKIDTAIVYGISAGGLTAIALAANYPQKANKLILASAISHKWLEEDSKIYAMAQRVFHPRFQKVTWKMVRSMSRIAPKQIAKNFLREFSKLKDAHPTSEEARELALALKVYSSGEGFITDVEHELLDDTLEKIACPTLVLHSIHDNSVDPEHARHAAAKIPGAQLELIDNKWGHMIWLGDDYERTLTLILAFIRK